MWCRSAAEGGDGATNPEELLALFWLLCDIFKRGVVDSSPGEDWTLFGTMADRMNLIPGTKSNELAF